MWEKRQHRISRRLFSVLQESDIPTLPSHEDDRQREGYGRTHTKKHFETSDGKLYYVSFGCRYRNVVGDDLYQVCSISFAEVNDKSKNTIEVLKGVLSKVREIIAETNPDYLVFWGTSKSRDRLYDVMVRRFFPGRFWKEDEVFYVALGDNPIPQGPTASRLAILQDLPEVPYHDKDYKRREEVTEHFETSDGSTYHVSFDVEDTRSRAVLWGVTFSTSMLRDPDSGHPFRSPRSQRKLEVIGNVAGILKRFIDTHKPDALTFYGTSESRDRLYKMLLKRFAPGKWYWDMRLDGFVLVLNKVAWDAENAIWEAEQEEMAEREMDESERWDRLGY